MGKMIAKFGFKMNMVLGLIVLSVSLFIFAGNTPVGGNFVSHVLLASLLGALGMSLAYIPATIAAMSGAKPEEAGLASGLANTSYQIGSAIGLAAMVAIAGATTATNEALDQVVALNLGFQAAFFWSGVIAASGALLALLFIRTPKHADHSTSSAM
ncbi:MFS transporter [Paenibacillus sp. M.A.Huq-84]